MRDAKRRATAAWLIDANADLAAAKTLSAHRDEDSAPFAAAFHAQQAVEKALKALLIWHATDYPPRHDLSLLVGLLPEGSTTRVLPIAGLTVYAVEQLVERSTWDEAEEAIATAQKALSAVSVDLRAAGWAQPR